MTGLTELSLLYHYSRPQIRLFATEITSTVTPEVGEKNSSIVTFRPFCEKKILYFLIATQLKIPLKDSPYRDLSEYDILSPTASIVKNFSGSIHFFENPRCCGSQNSNFRTRYPTTIYTKMIDLVEIYNNICDTSPPMQYNPKIFPLENPGFLTLKLKKVGVAYW
jgi:hypothetical protein